MNRLAFIYLILILVSCKKWEVEKNKTDSKILIAVSCLISPVSPIITVSVTKSVLLNQVINSDSLEIKNAIVTISDLETTLMLNYNPLKMRYEGLQENFMILSGKTYFLVVKVKEKILEASCRVPEKPQILAISNKKEPMGIQFSLKWKNKDEAYLIKSEIDGITNFNIPTKLAINWDDENIFVNPVIKSNILDEFLYSGKFIIPTNIKLNKIFTTVTAIDKNYKLYIEKRGKVDSSVGILERFSEPNLGFSNIKGGIGVFGAVYPITTEDVIVR